MAKSNTVDLPQVEDAQTAIEHHFALKRATEAATRTYNKDGFANAGGLDGVNPTGLTNMIGVCICRLSEMKAEGYEDAEECLKILPDIIKEVPKKLSDFAEIERQRQACAQINAIKPEKKRVTLRQFFEQNGLDELAKRNDIPNIDEIPVV